MSACIVCRLLGSIVKSTDSVGTTSFSRQYDAWGNLEVGAGLGGYAFTGRESRPRSMTSRTT